MPFKGFQNFVVVSDNTVIYSGPGLRSPLHAHVRDYARLSCRNKSLIFNIITLNASP